MNEQALKTALAAQLSFWPRLTEQEQQFLCAHTALVHYARGQILHDGGAACTGVLLVQKGQLRTYILSDEGREITLYRLGAGEICILSASCVLDAITFDVVIAAEADTEVLLLNQAAFKKLTEENIYARCFGYELSTTRFSEVMWTLQQILFWGVDQRLALFLWQEKQKLQQDTLQLTQEQIARDIGSAREVVSRMLKYFAREGIVKLSRGGIQILDNKKLQALLPKS
ncbi:MAG: Crp/Fnr family transcriptional regulator [Acidaminococcaceae bacterium]|jgi:CRP/FNR family transcriptional regulator|nr:Crp/Fnr family transcriptional regulator [Acidaminococcaceae bacterium]